MKATLTPTMLLLALLSIFAVFTVGIALPEAEPLAQVAGTGPETQRGGQGSCLGNPGCGTTSDPTWEVRLYQDANQCNSDDTPFTHTGAGSLACKDVLGANWDWKVPGGSSAVCQFSFWSDTKCTGNVVGHWKSGDDETNWCYTTSESIGGLQVTC